MVGIVFNKNILSVDIKIDVTNNSAYLPATAFLAWMFTAAVMRKVQKYNRIPVIITTPFSDPHRNDQNGYG